MYWLCTALSRLSSTVLTSLLTSNCHVGYSFMHYYPFCFSLWRWDYKCIYYYILLNYFTIGSDKLLIDWFIDIFIKEIQLMMVVVMWWGGSHIRTCGAWWLSGRFVAFRLNGHRFESHSGRHIGPLDKSFTHSCTWRFCVKLRHCIRAVGSTSE